MTAYLCFQVFFLFGHRPGVPENMTVQEFMNRHKVKEEDMFMILVEKHKTVCLKSAGVALSLEEEKIFQDHFSFVWPALLKSSAPVQSNFLLSTMVEKLVNISKIVQKFLGKIFPNGMRPGVSVSNQSTVRHLITTIN